MPSPSSLRPTVATTGYKVASYHLPAAHLRQCPSDAETSFHNFPPSDFKYCLTLFSKFFSSFAHATCSLSVSRQYLALDEIYHPFSVAIPGNTTRRTHIVRGELRVMHGVLTLYDALFQWTYTQVARRPYVSRLQLEHPPG
eukprot:g17856.t1